MAALIDRAGGVAHLPRGRQLQLASVARRHRGVPAPAGRIRAARRALKQSHTLPPRTGGAAAAIRGAPSANVLGATHSGFCPDGGHGRGGSCRFTDN